MAASSEREERRKAEALRVLERLPEALPEDVMLGMIQGAREDLGGSGFIIYRRESWDNSFDDEIGWPTQEDAHPRWATACRCSVCGSEWHSGWGEGHRILAAQGEDGWWYPGIPSEEEAVVIDEGDAFCCPYCGDDVTAISAASLRNGRTYRLLMGRVENLGTLTAVIFWMLERRVDREADSTYTAMPWQAVVVGSDGGILRYQHTKGDGFGRKLPGDQWRISPHMGEPIRSRYYSWGAINNTQMGGYYVTDVPDQLGMSGEKTGLAEYITAGGDFPMAYLLRQRRWKGLENLVKAGWTYTIDDAIAMEIHENTAQGRFLKECFDLQKIRPRDMLRMTKEEVTALGPKHWSFDRIAVWKSCEGLGAMELEMYCERYTEYDVSNVLRRYGAADLKRIDTYLRKQGEAGRERGQGLRMYLDYRRMLREAGGGETEIELFPPHLRAAHDRLAEARRFAKNHVADELFAAVAEKWSALEWSDGEICTMLPRSESDLVEEGATLRHCVGTYAKTHTEGRLVLFVRHARRPERSWYTLNVDLTGETWREVQLHGYGNEWAHGKTLRIPDRVREFVDRWEREVLDPVFHKIKTAEKKKQKDKENAA